MAKSTSNALVVVQNKNILNGSILKIKTEIKEGQPANLIVEGGFTCEVYSSLLNVLLLLSDYMNDNGYCRKITFDNTIERPVHGPCLGVPLYLSILGAIKNKQFSHIASTGEIIEDGTIKGVGYLAEKMFAAWAHPEIDEVIIPKENEEVVRAVLKDDLVKISPVSHVAELLGLLGEN